MSLYRFLLACALISTLLGSPKGEKVAAGKAAVNRSREGILSVLQQSERAVINWESFSIQAGEVAQFVQPSSSSAVLNRVVGPLRSEIFGTLKANGHVVLLNPNGVLIGASGVIQTGGFLSSTLDVSDKAFMEEGTFSFSGDSPNGVINLGLIETTGSGSSLIGQVINTEGLVRATNVKRQGGRIFLSAEGGAVYHEEGSLLGETEASGIFSPSTPVPLSGAVSAVYNLTNVERMQPNTDYAIAIFREEFGMYARQAKSGSRRIFGRAGKLGQNVTVLDKNQDYFLQTIVDGQRIRLMDAKLQYPFVKEEEIK